MPKQPPVFRPAGYNPDSEAREKYRKAEADKRRGSSSARGYGGKWRKARERYLKQNPLCAACFAQGTVTPATVVDHIDPHKGDQKKFWNTRNWQALCHSCHSRKTASEDGGFGNKQF